MKHLRSGLVVLVLVAVAVVPLSTRGAFQAADVIGQRRSGSPAFTINGANNSPNDVGFHAPNAVAVDSVGQRLFVSDKENRRILVYSLTASGELASTTAIAALGAPDTATQGVADDPDYGDVISSSTIRAVELVYDADNQRLFASDNLRILVFDVASITNGEPAVNVLGQPDFDTLVFETSSSTSEGSLHGMTYDAVGERLFAANSRRILVFDVASITNGEPAVNVLGQPDFDTWDLPAYTASSVDASYGLAYAAGSQRLFVGDSRRILVFDVASITNGEPAVNVLGHSDFTTNPDVTVTSSTLQAAEGMAYDPTGDRLFVADSNERLLVFDVASITNGEPAVNVLGQPNFTSQTTDTSNVAISAPLGLAHSADDQKLYLADQDNNRVMIWDVASITNGEAAVGVVGHVIDGSASFDYGGIDNGPGVNGLKNNDDLVLDAVNHRLFVADRENNRVVAFDLGADNNFEDYDADYAFGQPDMYTDTPGATATKMALPSALAFDPDGERLFVGESDNFRVLVFDVSAGSIATGMAAMNVLGQEDFTTVDGGEGGTRQFQPSDLVYETEDQRLFLADRHNGRVLVFDAGEGVLEDFMEASNVIGFPDFDSSYSGAESFSSSTVFEPQGLAYDTANHRLFVADPNAFRVMVFNVATSTLADGMPASHVLGRPDFTSELPDEVETSATSTLSLTSLVYDSSNERLFVGDRDRVLGFDVAPGTISNGMAASAVLGQADFVSNECGTSDTLLCASSGLEYDPSNKRLYVSDTGNNRIVAYDQVKITTVSLPDATVGQAYAQEIDTENEQGTVTFSLADGSLPPGMMIGSVDGTPTTPGVYTFTIRAADMVPQVGFLADDETYMLTVNAAPSGGSSRHSGGRALAYAPPSSAPATSTPTSTPSSTPAAPVPGSTEALQAQIQSLLSQLADLKAKLGLPAGPLASFARDLALGSNGEDVKALQQFLNSHGFPVATAGPGSPGNETMIFGPLTRAALVKFQVANGISPAAGYFGPKTRAFVNSLLSGGQ